MLRYGFILMLFLFIGCAEETDSDLAIESKREMKLTIDNELFEINENREPFQYLNGNTNCNTIFINTYIQSYQDGTYARLEFDFNKRGHLKAASLLESQKEGGPYKHFFSAVFNPKKYLEISDFIYDSTTNDISFSFEGKLFRHELGTSDTLRTLSGHISMPSLIDVECSYQPNQRYIDYQSDDFEFFSIWSSVNQNDQTLNHEYNYRSDLGFKLEILSQNDLWDYAEGTSFQFDSNSFTNKINLYEYVGHPMTSRNNGISDNYWQKFNTSGSFEIIEKIEENSRKIIIGKLDMDVFFEEDYMFTIQDMQFSTESYE